MILVAIRHEEDLTADVWQCDHTCREWVIHVRDASTDEILVVKSQHDRTQDEAIAAADKILYDATN